MHAAVAEIHRFASSHLGLVTRDAARRAGLSAGGWRAWLRSGRLIPVHESVAHVPGTVLTPTRRIYAGVLACGSGAAASHATAAWLWDLDGFEPEPIHVTVPVRARNRIPAEIFVHRPIDLADLRPVLRHGVPTTNPLRILCDLGTLFDDEVVAEAVERFLIAKNVTVAAIMNALGRHSKRGRAGIGALRRAMDNRLLGDRPPDSVLEVTVGRFLAANGLGPAVFHAIVAGLEVDFLFPAERLVLEVDGRSVHARVAAFENDRERDQRLAAAGYLCLRITYAQLRRDPAGVATRLALALDSRRTRSTPGAPGAPSTPDAPRIT